MADYVAELLRLNPGLLPVALIFLAVLMVYVVYRGGAVEFPLLKLRGKAPQGAIPSDSQCPSNSYSQSGPNDNAKPDPDRQPVHRRGYAL